MKSFILNALLRLKIKQLRKDVQAYRELLDVQREEIIALRAERDALEKSVTNPKVVNWGY